MKSFTSLLISLLALLRLQIFLDEEGGKTIERQVRCLKVIDGDTLVVEVVQDETSLVKKLWPQKSRYSLRLLLIDAPEIGQLSLDGKAVGKWAQGALKQMACQKKHFLYTREKGKKDLYGRTLGDIWTFSSREKSGFSLSQRLIQQGYAFIYPYTHFSSPWERWQTLDLMMRAMRERRGLWKTKGVENPWVFRKRKRYQGRLAL